MSSAAAPAEASELKFFGLTEDEHAEAKERGDKALLGLEFAPTNRKGQVARYTRGSYETMGLRDHLRSLPEVKESLWNFREQVHSPVRDRVRESQNYTQKCRLIS